MKLSVKDIVNLHFIQVKYLVPHWTNHQRRRTHIFLCPMPEALYEVYKLQILLNPIIEELHIPTNTKQEPENCSLVAATCNIFSCKKCSHKTPAEMLKHIHFTLSSDEPPMQRGPLLFQSLFLSPPMYQDLTHKINYSFKLQYQHQLRKSPDLMLLSFGLCTLRWN